MDNPQHKKTHKGGEIVRIEMLAQGKTWGSTLTMHQQTLTTGPFGNTCEQMQSHPK
jgi:hypothetical protein